MVDEIQNAKCERGQVFGDVALNCDDVTREWAACRGTAIQPLDWSLVGECYDVLKEHGVAIEISDMPRSAGYEAACTVTMAVGHIFVECPGSNPMVCFVHAACEVLKQLNA